MVEFMVLQQRRKMYKICRDSCVLNYKDLCRFKKENIQHFLQDKNEIRGRTLKNEEIAIFILFYLFILFIYFIYFLCYVGYPGFQIGVA